MPDAADLTGLSDAEIEATILLLGERAQQITNATERVRAERHRRAVENDATRELTDEGWSYLSDAVAGAPAKVTELADAQAEE